MRRLYSIGIPKSTSGKRFGRTPGKGFNRNQPGGGSLTANGWYRKFHPLVRSIPYYGTRRTMVRYRQYQTEVQAVPNNGITRYMQVFGYQSSIQERGLSPYRDSPLFIFITYRPAITEQQGIITQL